jgi:molecular chaperone Hsp33
LIQPFQLDATSLRGRLVRLGEAIDEVLSKHDYPEPVAQILGETMTLAVMLANMLKFEGIFTLQTKGDGPVGLMVADVTSTGDLRGFAKFDEGKLAAVAAAVREGVANVPALLGSGYIAFTVDQGEHTERYQGIVELTGETMADCVRHYFRQSEQLDAGIWMAVGRRGGVWRGGGIMLQRLPEEGGHEVARGSADEDGWRRAMVLLGSCTADEMLDPSLYHNDLLYRLFHEDGVRVFAPTPIRHACRCSRERVVRTLQAFPREQMEEFEDDGRIVVTCEFCNTRYEFLDQDLEQVYAP